MRLGNAVRVDLTALACALYFALRGSAAVAAPEPVAEPAAIPAHGLRLPATFTGELPCADCEAIRHHLDLWPDQVYHLRREWVGRDLVKDDAGRWRIDAARNALLLQSGSEMPLQFEILGPGRLRLLDRQGQPIESRLPYELTRIGTLSPTELSLLLGGEFRYLAEAAQFTECLTGRTYPVAMEADFANLERAYRDAAEPSGAPLYVTIEGSIVDRPKMEGGGVERTVVVDRFVNTWPGERCERAMADASLSNTYWRIVRLGHEPVSAVAGRREPHLVLRSGAGDARYSATVGCNALAGTYAVEGDAIRFTPAAVTPSTCPYPLDALEHALGVALKRAGRWQIRGNTLEFLDGAGTPVALFQAVYF
jgi:copper homeostasis protein (lipoprotein)